MEPEGSLPYWQASATRPYPEPTPSSPYPHIPLPEDPSSPQYINLISIGQKLMCTI